MNKIDKLDKELEKQKQEEENSQIVQAVRSLKLTPPS